MAAADEVTALRAELYATRRAAQVTQAQLTQASAERDELALQVSDLHQAAEPLRLQAAQAHALESSLQADRAEKVQLQREVQELRDALSDARMALKAEQARCQQTEEELRQMQHRYREQEGQHRDTTTAHERSQAAAEPSWPVAEAQSAVRGRSAPPHEGEGAVLEQTKILQAQVARLNGSRDRLLFQLSAHAADVERLSIENVALGKVLAQELWQLPHAEPSEAGLSEVREVAGVWEAQTQAALAQIEHLKDLLEESAAWPQKPPRLPHTPHSPTPPREVTAGDLQGENRPATPLPMAQSFTAQLSLNTDVGSMSSADNQPEEEHLDLGRALVQERAVAAAADLAVRALCAELNRAADVTGDLGRSFLPALASVEGRLAQLLAMPASA